MKSSFNLSRRDIELLERAYDLARLGKGRVSPNPCVGAVLRAGERIIGEGFHRSFGNKHAEINCLDSVKTIDRKHIPGSTMYVSLEPCSHFGKTPPCADAIIRENISRVVIGIADPNDKVSGEGIRKLRKANVQVDLAPLTEKAIDSCRPFLYQHVNQRPYVILKWAQSRDGYISVKGQRTKISNTATDTVVHQWRSEIDAILIGSTTATIDNPRLSTRLIDGRSPLRVLIDRNEVVPRTHHLFADGRPTLVFTLSQKMDHDEFVPLPEETSRQLPFILDQLHQRGIQSVMIEGGAKILHAFIHADLWDEARVITGAFRLKEGVKAPTVIGTLKHKDEFGMDSAQYILNKTHAENVFQSVTCKDSLKLI